MGSGRSRAAESRSWPPAPRRPHARPSRPRSWPIRALGSSVSAGKLLIVGAVAGSALTIGLGLALLGPAQSGRRDAGVAGPAGAGPRGGERQRNGLPHAGGRLGPDDDGGRDRGDRRAGGARRPSGRAAPDARRWTRASSARGRRSAGRQPRGEPCRCGPRPLGQDVLMHEAALIGQARTAIVQGRPAAALDALDAGGGGRSWPRLEPEGGCHWGRVRALPCAWDARTRRAQDGEETLRVRYPDSFLSRSHRFPTEVFDGDGPSFQGLASCQLLFCSYLSSIMQVRIIWT